MDEASTLRLLAAPDTTPFVCGACPLHHPKHTGWIALGGVPFATYSAIAYPEVPEIYVDVAFGDWGAGKFSPTSVFGVRIGQLPWNGQAGYEYTGSTILLTDVKHPLNVTPDVLQIYPRRDDFWRVVAWLVASEPLVAQAASAVAQRFASVGASA
jgi:hypothetical protein